MSRSDYNNSSSDEDDDIANYKLSTQMDTMSIRSVYSDYLSNPQILQLKPPYQRDICWSAGKMNTFINSIMNQLVIPSYILYGLNSTERKEEKYEYECIDGQHRLITIKLFMSNTMIPNSTKYIYWKDETGRKVFYSMGPDVLRRSRGRNMTIEEKHLFNSFKMQLQIISCKSGLSLQKKCIIFNRLQNGEKLASYDRLKNANHPITSCIQENKLLNYINDKKIINKISVIGNKKLNQVYIYLLIRTFLIIDKKSLDIDFLDINITKYIYKNNNIENDISEICHKVKRILKFISIYEFPATLIMELLYIFINIFANYGKTRLNAIIDNLIQKNKFTYFNDIRTYRNGIDMNNRYEQIIQY
jgi:hypothetical protein